MPGGSRSIAYARTWLNSLSLRQLLLLAGAIILLVSGLFGGLQRAATASTITKLNVGTSHVSDPFKVTIKAARWSTSLPDGTKSKHGRYLYVLAKVRMDDKRSVGIGTLQELIKLRGLEGFYPNSFDVKTVSSAKTDAEILSTTDSAPVTEMVPHLSYDVAFVWEQDKSQQLPTTLTVELSKQTWRQSSIDQQYAWFDTTPDAVGTFPLKEAGS
jgi:hypothetical protein